jgi:hypothetical protein
MDSKLGTTALIPIYLMVAMSPTELWPRLLMFQSPPEKTSTGKLFYKYFRQVQGNQQAFREHLGMTRRMTAPAYSFESLLTVPRSNPNEWNLHGPLSIVWQIRQILSRAPTDSADAWLCPSIYSSRMLPMPSSLARYAAIFYASSLVRYRPSMFDPQSCPQNSYLFDAVARECALPLLIDALCGLEGKAQIFVSKDGLRL